MRIATGPSWLGSKREAPDSSRGCGDAPCSHAHRRHQSFAKQHGLTLYSRYADLLRHKGLEMCTAPRKARTGTALPNNNDVGRHAHSWTVLEHDDCGRAWKREQFGLARTLGILGVAHD